MAPVNLCSHVWHVNHHLQPLRSTRACAAWTQQARWASPAGPRHAQPDWIGGGLASKQIRHTSSSLPPWRLPSAFSAMARAARSRARPFGASAALDHLARWSFFFCFAHRHRAGGEAMQKRARVDGSCGSRAGGPRVFLGYRVDSDADLVERLYDKLVSEGVDVWWDARCLPPGQPWEEGFADGLCSSDVFVPVISKAALAPFASLTPESRCDNVLLEHQLALELKMRGKLHCIFPVFVGVLEHHGELGEIYGDFFKGGGIPNCPEVIVGSVEAKLKEHLFRKEKGVPQLPDATRKVAGTLKAITDHQGVPLSGIKRDAFQKVVVGIVRACGAHRASPFVQHESAHTRAREGDDSEAGAGAKRANTDSRDGSKAAEKRAHDAGEGSSSRAKKPKQDSASASMSGGSCVGGEGAASGGGGAGLGRAGTDPTDSQKVRF